MTATALAVVVGLAIPAAPAIKAEVQPVPRGESILPADVGMGVPSDEPVSLTFPMPMDRSAVAASLGLAPATDVSLRWSGDSRSVALVPAPRWVIDERYVVHVPAGTATADGSALATDWRASFTTQTAPHVVRLRVDGVDPATDLPFARQEVMASTGMADSAMSALTDDLEADASAGTRIGVTFSTVMRGPETEAAFRLTPDLSGTFAWEGTTLWFTPEARLVPGTRYTVTVAGARDVDGNPLGGDVSFSFTTRTDALAMTVSPSINATGVAGGAVVQVSFSQPMATAATGSAFTLTDATTGRPVVGTVGWSPDAKVLTFDPTAALPAGHTFSAAVGAAAHDADGNPVAITWRFRTAGGAAPRPAAPVATATPGGGSAQQYALNQVNAARASYGRAPLVLDATISAVAYAHAADMLAYNYFSHTSRNGMTFAQRLTAGGVSYGYRGENICFLGGASVTAALNWCHAQFMAEPYPGGGNHKDNILSPNFRRIGIGIATGGGKVYVVWDFTD